VEVVILQVEPDKRRISLAPAPPPGENEPPGPSQAGRPGFGTFGDLLKKKR